MLTTQSPTLPTSFSADLERARWDVPFFALRFLGVKLHPGQLRVAEAYLQRNPTGWRPAWHTICVAAGNRAGKTLVLAIVVFHSCIFKMGVRPPLDDSEKALKQWRTHPYFAFHFALQQEIAGLVFTEIVTILQGIHVAQRDRGCPLAREIPGVAEWTRKYMGVYPWITLSPMLGGAEIHFRTTAEKAQGALGRDMNLITFDECGFEPNLQFILDNVLHLRRLGTGGQLFLVSTPEEGLTTFADIFFSGDPEQPDRLPGRMSLRMSTRDNIGYGIDQVTFDALVGDMDEDHTKQNIDGYFIQGRSAFFNAQSVDNAFVEDMPELRAARDGHNYVQGVDPAIRNDAMWSIVFDATGEINMGVRCERSKGRKTVGGIIELAESVHFSYDVNRDRLHSRCSTAIDSVGFGGKMFQELMNERIPGGVRCVEFGGTTVKKRKLLGDLRSMLDSGRLKMPRSGLWLQVRRQLLGYKLDDKHIEQDAVMALVVAVSEMRRTPPDSQDTVAFDAFAVTPPIRLPVFNWRRPARQAASRGD